MIYQKHAIIILLFIIRITKKNPEWQNIYTTLFLWLLPKLLLLLDALSDSVIKFVTYHLHNIEKLGITESTNKLVINSANFIFAYYSSDYANWSSIVTKKKKPPKTFLYFFSYVF